LPKLALGVDFGTSGVRIAVNAATGDTLFEHGAPYPGAFEDPEGWRQGFQSLVLQLPWDLRQRIGAVALAGTSGTLLLCQADGALLEGDLGQALPYSIACPEQLPVVKEMVGSSSHPASQASGSVARALRLLERVRDLHPSPPNLLIRHQADWLMGWLLGCWEWGEEGNNLRLGWDLVHQRWLGGIGVAPWAGALPSIVASGSSLGPVSSSVAETLGLATDCLVVAGSTDASAAVLAADPSEEDGITILGSTLVLKQIVPAPIQAEGVSCHRINGRWLIGGASNTGTGVLTRFFSRAQVDELSRQLNLARDSPYRYRPLLGRGERFPVDDPELEPILEPRPVSDALFLQSILEGISAIELKGWERLRELGAPPVRQVITLGGGARNSRWRQMRERILGVPVRNCPQLTAARGMARLAQGRMEPPRANPA
jgi:sugar (pentulose or hexulose) kinase